MEDELHKRVIGQNEAIKALATAARAPGRTAAVRRLVHLRRAHRRGQDRAGQGARGSPFGDEDALITLDTSRYQETVSRPSAPPPRLRGLRCGWPRRRGPSNAFAGAFDQVEKAHQDLFNSLLQILEDGRLTDSQGRVAISRTR
ncbi:AAA family ATPase [Kocuria rhizophila]|nr:AAA family ATPase [Kocuria rhizophila]